MTGPPRRGFWRAWGPLLAYLAVVVAAAAYPFYKQATDLANSELAGVPLILVGMPWSLLAIELAALVSSPSEGLGPLLGLVLPGILVNAWLVRRL